MLIQESLGFLRHESSVGDKRFKATNFRNIYEWFVNYKLILSAPITLEGPSLFSVMRSVLPEFFKPVSQEDSRIEQSDNDLGVFGPNQGHDGSNLTPSRSVFCDYDLHVHNLGSRAD